MGHLYHGGVKQPEGILYNPYAAFLKWVIPKNLLKQWGVQY